MKTARGLLCAGVILILPSLAQAQAMATPPKEPISFARVPGAVFPGLHDLGAWWKNSEVVREIGLSAAQVGQVEQIFFEHRLKLIDLQADLEKQELRLQPLIEADQPDESKVGAQIDQVLSARGRLEKTNAMMMLAIRRVLSVEQWKKLQAIQQTRPRTLHPHVPFGAPPPPGVPVMLPPQPTPHPPQE